MVPADIHLQISPLTPRSCSSPGCQNLHSTQDLWTFKQQKKNMSKCPEILQCLPQILVQMKRQWAVLYGAEGLIPPDCPLARDGVRHLGSMSQPLPVPHTGVRTGWITFWGCLPLSAGWRRRSDDCQQPGCRASDSTLWASSVQFAAKAVISGGFCPENIR